MGGIYVDASVNIQQGLYNDLKKYAQNYAKGMALETKNILVDEAKNALDIFYGDYHPSVYDRTDNLHMNSFEPYYSNSHGSIYRGGVKFSSANMEEVYNAPAQWVFNLALGSGIHGLPGQGLPVTNPTPINRVEQKRDNLIGVINMLSSAGEAMARNDTYQFLHIN